MQPFIIERSFNTSAAILWEALTDKNKMKEWYFDLEEFKAEPGFEFSFYGGDENVKYLHRCRILEVIPQKKLSYTWTYPDYPGNSIVSFELFDEGETTKLRLTHSGIETFTQAREDKNFAPESFAAGWSYIIGESLKKWVEKS